MQLDTDEEIFVSGDRQAVLELLTMVIKGRHEWRPQTKAAFRAYQFAEEHVPHYKDFVEKAMLASVDRSPLVPAQRRVCVDDLRAVVDDLARSAVLIVEDEINEGWFIRALAGAFADDRIITALDNTWLVLAHAGGKDRMHRFVAARREQFTIVVRVAALLDSDQTKRSHRTRNHTYVRWIKEIDGVTEVHMWTGREMENYVPFRLWEECHPHAVDRVDAMRVMSLEERLYLDVKAHIGGGIKSDAIPPHIVLSEDDFHGLGAEVVVELRELLAMIHRIL
ncbi:hypothetical protein Ais01nite_32630 [Asanoa ishikariensis]|uniref:Uncharacterized protein n=1 Tax=Asanoa ishikariensis TaxID=137265 RepID=A0A1H3UW88_9ACTN|nr:hypothetical protein [Asanoa ishikariensis]GIF65228.1 hypothetical protein Ais01nite_32630 [Asanoa ishikariensis]SDZ66694.1 hypothetical protein SAMN05421684_8266 [Asanoa ishikariensis]